MIKHDRRYLIGGLLITFLALGGVWVDQQTRPRLRVGPMVQIPERGSLVITWEADAFFEGGAVRLKYLPFGHRLYAPAQKVSNRYQVVVNGDTPGTKYRYEVMNRGFLGREFVVAGPFETAAAPPRGRAFRFLAFGDSGTGNNTQASLAEVMARAEPDLIIHTGDVIYPAGSPDDYRRNFFEPYREVICRTPFMPSLGNHDCATRRGRPLIDTFVLPRNAPPVVPAPDGTELDLSERCYWFDYGDARFVALDSNLADDESGGVLTQEQMETIVAPWLQEVLTSGEPSWKFVYFHHPFYTGSKHSESDGLHMKNAYLGILEDGDADIVFCGHNHLYERTAPMKGGQVVPDGAGVVYVTTGAGGAARYEERQPPPSYMRAFRDDLFSFTQVDVTRERIVLQQIGEDGRSIDEYVIVKNATGAGSAGS